MNRQDSSTKGRTWKYLSERERYNIELLLKEGYKQKQIAQVLNRDRRTIEREIKKGAVCKRIENPYLSRNPKVPDYTMFKSITMDNGTEFVDQQTLEASYIKAGKKRTTCYPKRSKHCSLQRTVHQGY